MTGKVETVKQLLFVVLWIAAEVSASAGFRFRDVDEKSVELADNGVPVFVYNHGMMLKDGVPADRTRCCYLHPVYAPNGVVVTDDFPRDHFHHRGISWMWPVVMVGGKAFDLWSMKGIEARFEALNRKEASKDRAVLAFTHGWYVGDRKVVEEQVEIVAHPAAGGRRNLDFTLRLRPVSADVSIAGTPDGNKGYGGFNIRFAPRTRTRIHTAQKEDAPDSDLQPAAWAQLTGDFDGKPAGARITIDPNNFGSPNGWCLRHYGFLGVSFPGLTLYRLDPAKPLVMKYRVSLFANAP